MITKTPEKYIPLAEAAKLFPARLHIATVYRWAQKGFRGIKLRSIRVGHRVYTTPEDVEAFLQAINQSDDERLQQEGC